MSVSFVPTAPRLPGPLGLLQRVRYLRTAVQSLALGALLLARVWRHDVVHVLSASHSSFLISAAPAILVARLFGRKTILNYHSGEAADHLARGGRTAIPIMRLADAIVVPSETLASAFASHGLPRAGSQRDRPEPVPVSRAREPAARVPLEPLALAPLQRGVRAARLRVSSSSGSRGAADRGGRRTRAQSSGAARAPSSACTTSASSGGSPRPRSGSSTPPPPST